MLKIWESGTREFKLQHFSLYVLGAIIGKKKKQKKQMLHG